MWCVPSCFFLSSSIYFFHFLSFALSIQTNGFTLFRRVFRASIDIITSSYKMQRKREISLGSVTTKQNTTIVSSFRVFAATTTTKKAKKWRNSGIATSIEMKIHLQPNQDELLWQGQIVLVLSIAGQGKTRQGWTLAFSLIFISYFRISLSLWFQSNPFGWSIASNKDWCFFFLNFAWTQSHRLWPTAYIYLSIYLNQHSFTHYKMNDALRVKHVGNPNCQLHKQMLVKVIAK